MSPRDGKKKEETKKHGTNDSAISASDESPQRPQSATDEGLVRRLSKNLSRSLSTELERRRRSSFKEQLPQTTYGWTVFLSTLSSLILRYELNLQKSLTCPPLVYGQVEEGPLKEIYQEMTKSETSILVRVLL